MEIERVGNDLGSRIDPERSKNLALFLVRIPSPPGQERAVAETYAGYFSKFGLEVALDRAPRFISWFPRWPATRATRIPPSSRYRVTYSSSRPENLSIALRAFLPEGGIEVVQTVCPGIGSSAEVSLL